MRCCARRPSCATGSANGCWRTIPSGCGAAVSLMQAMADDEDRDERLEPARVRFRDLRLDDPAPLRDCRPAPRLSRDAGGAALRPVPQARAGGATAGAPVPPVTEAQKRTCFWGAGPQIHEMKNALSRANSLAPQSVRRRTPAPCPSAAPRRCGAVRAAHAKASSLASGARTDSWIPSDSRNASRRPSPTSNNPA